MKKILIIGAGISGLYLANLLEKNGNYDYKILEKKKVFNLQEGYGIQLSVNGVKLLNEIGFREIAIHDINYPRNINFYNSKNLKLISKIEISKFNNNQNFYTTIKRSVLINFLLKRKISIVSSKVQTTNENIQAVLNHNDCQMIFVDTPGIINKKKF